MQFEKPTAQLLGRFQTFHKGHEALARNAIETVGQVVIMVRTMETSTNNPYNFDEIKGFIDNAMKSEFEGRYLVVQVPNITAVHYGRDVGYSIDKIELGVELESISATQLRSVK
mgnify:FL=1|jgi:adenylylsulfate kinase|tara:strand:+ start:191 stop:532 length:342 start_codon:yes stop_codon:yes gene_type:complete